MGANANTYACLLQNSSSEWVFVPLLLVMRMCASLHSVHSLCFVLFRSPSINPPMHSIISVDWFACVSVSLSLHLPMCLSLLCVDWLIDIAYWFGHHNTILQRNGHACQQVDQHPAACLRIQKRKNHHTCIGLSTSMPMACASSHFPTLLVLA
jgi:hypothetical protein